MPKTLWPIILLCCALAIGGYAVHRHWHPHSTSTMDASTQPSASKSLWHCGMHPQVIQDHPGTCPICHMALTPLKETGSSGSAGAGPSVTIDPSIVQNMGVRTALVTRGPLDLTVRAVGMLKVPQPGLHEVSLRINGWIEKLYANTEGMHIRKGDPLFDLYSPDLQVAAEELISASRSRKAMEASASAAVLKDADGLIASARRKLRLWDVAEEDISAIAAADTAPRTVPFRSPSNGAIVESSVVQGSSAQAGVKLMRIEDHSSLWLDAEVYEESLSLIALDEPVEATVQAAPGKTFTGKVSFIHPHVDHMTRTQIIRTTLDNPDGSLKPGMFAAVKIIARPLPDALLVPREAVIDTGTRKIAFVARSEGRFEPRIVRTGLAGDNGQIQILEGLAADESVVTSGQFLMDVESRTTEAIDKLRTSPATSSDPDHAHHHH